MVHLNYIGYMEKLLILNYFNISVDPPTPPKNINKNQKKNVTDFLHVHFFMEFYYVSTM